MVNYNKFYYVWCCLNTCQLNLVETKANCRRKEAPFVRIVSRKGDCSNFCCFDLKPIVFLFQKEPLQLKELERIAPKEKQITMQSVKDVLSALVDDGVVQSEKIGGMTLFWAFPGQALQDVGCLL